MVDCQHCGKNVPVFRPFDGALTCKLCGRVLGDFNFNDEVTFIKNAAGQSQASGNIVSSVPSGNSSSRARRIRIARDEFMNLRDALQIGERDDVINMAVRFFTLAAEQNFTKGRRAELVLSSCLYLSCRKKEIPVLLIDFSSYLRVCVYELGSVYLQLCKLLFFDNTRDYEELVDPSLFIPRFTDRLLKGAHNDKTKDVKQTAKNIIASMNRDWMQTGRKPSGICGAAIYIAALSHGIMCSSTDIAETVHMCGATITKRLNEFANTEAASLTVEKLVESESILRKQTFNTKPNSDKEVVNCEHTHLKRFGYGLCKDCHDKFIKISGGVVGGSDPPAFQRAEKERMEKAAREENEGGVGSGEQVNVRKCPEKGEGEKDGASDESGNFSDVDDSEVDYNILDEKERQVKTRVWNLLNKDYLEEQAAKEEALKAALNVSNAANCPEHARNLVEASKAAVAKSRKEKKQKRAEEEKDLPPPATTMEAIRRTLEKKRLSGFINYDILDELLDISPGEKSQQKSTTETVREKKKEVEIEEEPYEMNTDEKFYEDQVEEEEDGYDFGLY